MKKIVAFVAATLLAMSMAACGGDSKEAAGKTPAASEVVTAVAGQLTFKDNMLMVEEGVFSNFYNLDESKIEDRAMYTGESRATAEEVTVIRMKDAKDAGLAEEAIKAHLADQKTSFENYIPEEMPKLENAGVYKQGAYVLLVVADDVSKAEETFKAQF